MNWGTIHWMALFLAFLGPLFGPMSWLSEVMFLLGVVMAFATYNSGINLNSLILLLLGAVALTTLPSLSYTPLSSYLSQVAVLSGWYVLPIAVAQAWKGLIS